MRRHWPEAANGTSCSESEEEVHALSPNSVYLDLNDDVKLHRSVSGNNLREDETEISELVKAVINHEGYGDSRGEILSFSTVEVAEENIGGRVVVSEENVRMDLEEDSDDEEVIELELERAVEKLHTHTPYCCNCRNQITEVILLRRRRRSPRAETPMDLLGCSSCFSIFIPSASGDCLNPFNIFGSKPKVESTNVGDVQPSADVGGTTAIPAAAEAESPQTEVESPKMHIKYYPSTDVPSTSTTANAAVAPDDSNLWIFGKREVVNEEEKPETPTDHHLAVDIACPTTTEITIIPREEIGVDSAQQPVILGVERSASFEMLKCIVYGGLISSVGSFTIISSAAASNASTAKVITIGLATLISGLIPFYNVLLDLKNEEKSAEKYEELLGTEGHFGFHATTAIISYLVFGLVAPSTYGFAFQKSDDKDYKIIAVGAATFACVFFLAIAKAYVRGTKTFTGYFKTILYYVTMVVGVSGVREALTEV